MILNEDSSLDLWSAACGTYGYWDVITYSRLYQEGTRRTKETVAVLQGKCLHTAASL